MKVPKKMLAVGFVLLGGLALLTTGCSKKISVEEGEARVAALESKGVPDSVISAAKVYLYQFKSAKATGNAGLLRRYRDSLQLALGQVEGGMEADIQKLKPLVDSLVASINERRPGLTGLHKAAGDSVYAILDALVGKNWLPQAKDKAVELDALVDTLNAQEKLAKQLRPRFVGNWTSSSSPADKRFKAVERRTIVFGRDGSMRTMEQMKGQTSEYLKEDWKFESLGKWDIKGDVAYQYVEREKCSRQVYTNYNVKERKWERKEMPTYDSTITDGSKDRWVTYDYLKENFKKVR